MKHYKYLDTTSIFLALLGNRPSHCKIQLFFLQAIFSQHAKFKRIRAVSTHQCYMRCGPFWHKSKLAVSVPLLVILFPFTTIGSANLGSSQSLRWKENQVKMGGSSNQMILPIFLSLWHRFLLQHWLQCTQAEQRRQRRCRRLSTSQLPRIGFYEFRVLGKAHFCEFLVLDVNHFNSSAMLSCSSRKVNRLGRALRQCDVHIAVRVATVLHFKIRKLWI